MKSHSQNSERMDRLGLILSLLAIVFWPFSIAYQESQYATLTFNLLACLFLQRSSKGVLLARTCLILTLTGLVITLGSPLPHQSYDLQPFAFASGLSTFSMMLYFSTLGIQARPETRAATQTAVVNSEVEKPPIPATLWAAILVVVAASLMLLGIAFHLEEVAACVSVPMFLVAPLVFVYGVISGVGREVMRKAKTSDDLDSKLPSV